MEYIYSPLKNNSSNNFYNYSKKVNLLKKSDSSDKKANLKNDNSFKTYSSNSQYTDSNYNTLKIVNKDLYSINDSQKEIDSSDDIIISNFRTNDSNRLKSENKMIIRNNANKIKQKINNINENKKISHSLKKLLVSKKSENENKNVILNNCCENKSISYYINIIKKNSDKNKDLININKTLFNNLTERNMKINKLIKENNLLKSKMNNYLLEEYHSKLNNDNSYYEKYNQLEKEFNILKSSLLNYQKQNEELKNKINELKAKNVNDKDKAKEILPIKVNIKERMRNSYCEKINSLDLIAKDNNKLLSENKIYKSQIKEKAKKIKELLLLIENKDNYINLLKNNIIDEKDNIKIDINKILENKEISKTQIKKYNFLRHIRTNNNINKSVDKLLIENEENKKKINQIFEKINDLGNIDKGCKQYININIKELDRQLLKQKDISSNEKKDLQKENFNNCKVEKNEMLFKNTKNNNNNFSIQKNEIIIKNNNSKNKPKFDYQIQKNEINFIINNFNNKINNNKKLEIININSIEYISYKKVTQKEKINLLNKENIINFNINSIEKRHNRFYEIKEEEEEKNNEIEINDFSKNKLSLLKIEDFEKKEKRNNSNKHKEKKKIKILDGIDITEINTLEPVRIQSSLSFLSNNDININHLYLFGLHKDNHFLKFDLINKKWLKPIKISDIEDLSETFQNNYIYENSIIYNALNGFLILTGKNANMLYYYNSLNETLINLCKFNGEHSEGNMILDRLNNRIFVLAGKNSEICEYYSFNDKKTYEIPKLNINRINSSLIIQDNKIYCFFGYSNLDKNYINTIEYIDMKKLDRWNIIAVKDLDGLLIEKMATFVFKEEPNYIYFYCGMKRKDGKDGIIEENIMKFNVMTTNIEIIKDYNFIQYKYIGYRWRKCDVSHNIKEKTFIFEKVNDFIELPDIDKNVNENVDNFKFNKVKVLIDADNNIHYIFNNSKNVEIFRAYYK